MRWTGTGVYFPFELLPACGKHMIIAGIRLNRFASRDFDPGVLFMVATDILLTR